MKNKLLFPFYTILFILFLFQSNIFAGDESLMIKSYHPSPQANYKQINANKIAIGNFDNACWNNCGASDALNPATDLIVKSRVGIGVVDPKATLDINGTFSIRGEMYLSDDSVLISDGEGKAEWNEGHKSYYIPLTPPGDITISMGKHAFCVLGAIDSPNESQKCLCQVYKDKDIWFLRRSSYANNAGGCSCKAVCLY